MRSVGLDIQNFFECPNIGGLRLQQDLGAYVAPKIWLSQVKLFAAEGPQDGSAQKSPHMPLTLKEIKLHPACLSYVSASVVELTPSS